MSSTNNDTKYIYLNDNNIDVGYTINNFVLGGNTSKVVCIKLINCTVMNLSQTSVLLKCENMSTLYECILCMEGIVRKHINKQLESIFTIFDNEVCIKLLQDDENYKRLFSIFNDEIQTHSNKLYDIDICVSNIVNNKKNVCIRYKILKVLGSDKCKIERVDDDECYDYTTSIEPCHEELENMFMEVLTNVKEQQMKYAMISERIESIMKGKLSIEKYDVIVNELNSSK